MDTDDNVASLLAIVDYQLDVAEAKQLLANHNNDVAAALANFFDAGDVSTLRNHLHNSQAKWDETAFGGAGYGADEATLPTFNIDYAPGHDNYPHSTGNSRAPTRPPSRTSQRSVLSTHAGEAPLPSIENMQESGVVSSSNAVFGPATRDNYDTSQWAMIPRATEIISDPIPSQRKREQGQPAILKPSSNFNYLTSLIPILHSITLFRNALLCPGVLQDDYWMGEEWWKGNSSPPARIFDTSMGLSEAYGLDAIYEAQRFMAFLDKTDRIYGSVNSMLESDAWRQSHPDIEDADDDMLKFLCLWGHAFQSQVPNGELNGVLRSAVNVGGTMQNSFILDANVSRGQTRPDYSLYDVLDDALFADATSSAHITDISKVLILRLTSSNTNATDLGCRIPATLYVDRYLEQNKHVIAGMYSDIRQHENQLKEVQLQVEKLRYHTPTRVGAQKLDSLQLLQISMTAFEPRKDESIQSQKDAVVLSQLQDLYRNIESKLATLDEQIQQAQKTVAEITGRFKPAIDDGADTDMEHANDVNPEMTENIANVDYPEGQAPSDAMKHPYQLYGVATRHDVVYLLQPDITSDIPGAKQWWRMQYDTESSNPTIRRDRLSLQEVIERASTEAASALLVYANAEATSVEPLSLPKPLEDLVNKDNLNFLEELQSNPTGWENYGDEYGNEVQGDWDQDTSAWDEMNAQEFHNHAKQDEANMSSATLTPNTEMEEFGQADTAGEREDTIAPAPGTLSSASSDTVGRDDVVMDVDDSKSQGKVSFSDVDMPDAQDESRTQHIEVAEKKGG